MLRGLCWFRRKPAPGRPDIRQRTLRKDRWWLQPLLTMVALVLFIIYSTFRAFQNAYYFAEPYISPFFSPMMVTGLEHEHFSSARLLELDRLENRSSVAFTRNSGSRLHMM